MVTIPCGDICLEGAIGLPLGNRPFPVVVVCHPHPLYGGNMYNNVVTATCHALLQSSISYLKFNFRSVGRSQGEHADGIGEQDDLLAAISFLLSAERIDPNRIGLCGYSFGAGVALAVAARSEQVKALALVSPFLSQPSPIQSYHKPMLLLWGSEDFALPAADLEYFIEKPPGTKQFEVMSGADHFWSGYENEAADRVAAFFAGTL